VGVYGNAKSIRSKTLEELVALRERRLGIVYMGLETGDDVTLKRVRKGVTTDTIVKMGRKAMEAGMKLSVTVLLGLAGPERSGEHAEATGRALSALDPEHVGALSLMLSQHAPWARSCRRPLQAALAQGDAKGTQGDDSPYRSFRRAISCQPCLQLSSHQGKTP